MILFAVIFSYFLLSIYGGSTPLAPFEFACGTHTYISTCRFLIDNQLHCTPRCNKWGLG